MKSHIRKSRLGVIYYDVYYKTLQENETGYREYMVCILDALTALFFIHWDLDFSIYMDICGS